MPLSPPEGFWLRSNFASEASYPRGGGGAESRVRPKLGRVEFPTLRAKIRAR
jgi:hypothetical protein